MTPTRMAEIQEASGFRQRCWSAAEYQALLHDPGVGLVNEDAGFALFRNVAGESELLMISVLAHQQGRGVGRALLQKWQVACRKSGVGRLLLEVAADNTAALGLYRSEGFEEIGRRKNYYAQLGDAARVDALVMGKSSA